MAKSKTTFRKGHKVPKEWREKISRTEKGKRVSKESRKKMSKAKKGKLPWNKGLKGKQKSWLKGRKGYRNKGSFMIGKRHWNWKGGIDLENTKIRHSEEYKLWRNSVYERDNYTCQICGKRCSNENIVAHHILPFADYPHLRFAINNGITLCRSCHSNLHKNYENKTIQW